MTSLASSAETGKSVVSPSCVLALDTSTPQGGVAIVRADRVLARRTWQRGRSHSELLTVTIESCLAEAGVSLSDLDMIAAGKGPGSFTGIRIAINAARTLAFVFKKPIMAFDTTEIIAAGCARRDLPVAVLLNAQMNLLFFSTFSWDFANQTWRREQPLDALSPTEIESRLTTPHLALGDGYLDYQNLFSASLRSRLVRDVSCSDFPDPGTLGRLANTLGKTDSSLDWIRLQPLYIRASGAEEKLRGDSGPPKRGDREKR